MPDVREAVLAALPEPGPIFLAGLDRSGIGLLGELLERHPRIAMTRRTNFWSRYAERFGDLRQRENVDRCLDAMARDRRMKVFAPDRERLHDDLAASPTYPRLFELLQRQRMERMGRARWGDKSLEAERYADRLLRTFPTAKIIHVIRDPRDRYASQKHHRAPGRGGVGAGAAMWRWSVRIAERNARRHPDRYLVLRYEALVADPEGVLRNVCAFLGEAYVPDLLDVEGGSDCSGRTAAPASGPGPIHTASVGRYRKRLTVREVALLQWGTGRWLTRSGYDREPVDLTGILGLRLVLVDLPLHAVRMAVWGRWTQLGLALRRRAVPMPRA